MTRRLLDPSERRARRALTGALAASLPAALVGCRREGEVEGAALDSSGAQVELRRAEMITIRRSEERGGANHGWLNTKHTFSFSSYYDPAFMGFRSLRVINEDRVSGGSGFGTHPHKDMEIISYVLDGALGHKDSMGNGSIIRPGEVQRMSAGTGVTHSEMNPNRDDAVHFFQIWIVPEKRSLAPGYEQKFVGDARRGNLKLIASRDGRDDSVTVHQDVSLYASLLEPGESVSHTIAPSRHAWVQVARGAITLNGERLLAGDGAAISDEGALHLAATEPSELLVFDLA